MFVTWNIIPLRRVRCWVSDFQPKVSQARRESRPHNVTQLRCEQRTPAILTSACTLRCNDCGFVSFTAQLALLAAELHFSARVRGRRICNAIRSRRCHASLHQPMYGTQHTTPTC
jgi:hypothetical protein